MIPLTISNLNQGRFIPKKDYNANRLTSGMLQLSEGFYANILFICYCIIIINN